MGNYSPGNADWRLLKVCPQGDQNRGCVMSADTQQSRLVIRVRTEQEIGRHEDPFVQEIRDRMAKFESDFKRLEERVEQLHDLNNPWKRLTLREAAREFNLPISQLELFTRDNANLIDFFRLGNVKYVHRAGIEKGLRAITAKSFVP
jgi:hypothetical protein